MAAPASPTMSSATPNVSKKKDKKKSKIAAATARTASPAPTTSSMPDKTTTDGGAEDGSTVVMREIQKNIRNLTKKLANTAKTDAIIAEHQGKSLDDLIAIKVINADQKNQALKKPALQAQLREFEDQLTICAKVKKECDAVHEADKAKLEKDLADKYEAEKTAAVEEVRTKAEGEGKRAFDEKFLLFSQFLRLAAARRTEDSDPNSEESSALEGVLLAVYTADENAVVTIKKLVDGTEDRTQSVAGEQLQTTFAQVKAASQAYTTSFYGQEAADPEASSKAEADPTVENATLNELNAGDLELTNGHTSGSAVIDALPENAHVDNSAANAAAGSQWDNSNDMSASISQEWVAIPPDSSEVETAPENTIAVEDPALASASTATEGQTPLISQATSQSWADDQPDPAAAPATDNDGYHQVQQRSRGRGERDWRGGGRGREPRGRNYRGDYRSRPGRAYRSGMGGAYRGGLPRTEGS